MTIRTLLLLGLTAAVVAALSVLLAVAARNGGPSRSLAQEAGFTVCPPPNGWAMSVWTGASNTATGQAVATCTGAAVLLAAWLDYQTQGWQLWSAGVPEALNTLRTLNNLQPVFLRGSEAGPPTRIPIIDAHNHMMPGLTPEAIISVMDQVGATKIVVMAKGEPLSQSTQRTLDAQQRFPDRVIPFIGLNSVQTITRQVLNYIDVQLASGNFKGMGELLALHYESLPGSSNQFPLVAIPMDSPGALDLMCLAAKYNVVLTIHMETTSETVAKLELALQRYPHTKVIWAHQTHVKTQDGDAPENARKADPQQIAALMDRYPNLYADIAPGHETFFLTSSDRQLPDNWKSLYERYSDRFVVGLDMPFLDSWQDPQRPLNRVNWIRVWLSQLSPETQRKLASENIKRILAASPASVETCQFLTQ